MWFLTLILVWFEYGLLSFYMCAFIRFLVWAFHFLFNVCLVWFWMSWFKWFRVCFLCEFECRDSYDYEYGHWYDYECGYQYDYECAHFYEYECAAAFADVPFFQDIIFFQICRHPRFFQMYCFSLKRSCFSGTPRYSRNFLMSCFSPDNMDIPNVRILPNFLDNIFFWDSMVPPKFSNVPLFSR